MVQLGSCLLPLEYAVYAISSLDTEVSLRHGTQTAWGFVGTQQGVAGLTPRPFIPGLVGILRADVPFTTVDVGDGSRQTLPQTGMPSQGMSPRSSSASGAQMSDFAFIGRAVQKKFEGTPACK